MAVPSITYNANQGGTGPLPGWDAQPSGDWVKTDLVSTKVDPVTGLGTFTWRWVQMGTGKTEERPEYYQYQVQATDLPRVPGDTTFGNHVANGPVVPPNNAGNYLAPPSVPAPAPTTTTNPEGTVGTSTDVPKPLTVPMTGNPDTDIYRPPDLTDAQRSLLKGRMGGPLFEQLYAGTGVYAGMTGSQRQAIADKFLAIGSSVAPTATATAPSTAPAPAVTVPVAAQPINPMPATPARTPPSSAASGRRTPCGPSTQTSTVAWPPWHP